MLCNNTVCILSTFKPVILKGWERESNRNSGISFVPMGIFTVSWDECPTVKNTVLDHPLWDLSTLRMESSSLSPSLLGRQSWGSKRLRQDVKSALTCFIWLKIFFGFSCHHFTIRTFLWSKELASRVIVSPYVHFHFVGPEWPSDTVLFSHLQNQL